MRADCAYRLAPLPARVAKMKAQFQEYWLERSYAGYRSPWVPITDASRLKRGDLVVNQRFEEEEFLIGREERAWRNREIIERRMIVDENPLFVWVDTRNPKAAEPYLARNEFAGAYWTYSRLAGEFFAAAVPRSVFPFNTPVYHETDEKNSSFMILNGLCRRRLTYRITDGFPFHVRERQIFPVRQSHGHGKIVVFAVSGRLQYLDISNQWQFEGQIEWFFQGERKLSRYKWAVLCSELSVSAIKTIKGFVIFHDLDGFAASKVEDAPPIQPSGDGLV